MVRTQALWCGRTRVYGGPDKNHRVGRQCSQAGPVRESDGRKTTVTEALKALGKRPSLIAGKSNRLGYFFMGRMLSRARAIRIVSGSMEKMFGPFRKRHLK